MLKILIVPTGMLEENCYIIYEDTYNIAFLIDPGDEGERLSEILEAKGIRPKMVINTHGHFDHIGAVSYLKEKYEIPFLIHQGDLELLKDSNLGFELVSSVDEVEAVEQVLVGDEILDFLGYEIQVIATPGHTRGGVCLYIPKMKWLFTGDTLFKGTIGRTDLKGGNYAELILSINERLKDIPNDTIIFPGHGESSTMGEERMCNQYFDVD